MTKLFLTLVLMLSLGPIALAQECAESEYQIDRQLCLTLTWVDGPFLNEAGERKFSSALFSFRHLQGEQDLGLDPMKMRYYPWMIMDNGHQHGARPVTLQSISPHEVHVSKLLFTKMHGEWLLRLKLRPQGHDDLGEDYDFSLKLNF